MAKDYLPAKSIIHHCKVLVKLGAVLLSAGRLFYHLNNIDFKKFHEFDEYFY